MVTIIADNYYGYLQERGETQISYSANLFGLCEEEHAGGAIAYQSYDLGEEWSGERHVRAKGFKLEEVLAAFGDTLVRQARRLRRRSQSQEHHLQSRDGRDRPEAKRSCGGRALAESRRSSCSRRKRTYTPPATACAWRSRRETGPGASSAPSPRASPVPQTLHRLGWRQIRDLEAHLGRDQFRARCSLATSIKTWTASMRCSCATTRGGSKIHRGTARTSVRF
jgi:hypothetical protein